MRVAGTPGPSGDRAERFSGVPDPSPLRDSVLSLVGARTVDVGPRGRTSDGPESRGSSETLWDPPGLKILDRLCK